MFKLINWRTRMHSPDGFASGAQAPAGDAAPDGSQSQESDAQQGADESERPAEVYTRPELTAEQRHENAARRRAGQMERQNASVRELAELKANAETFARVNGFPSFQSMVEEGQSTLLREGRLTPELIRSIAGTASVESHPAVQAANSILKTHVIDDEMREFTSNPDFADSGIREVADFKNAMPPDRYAVFYGAVADGYSYSDAYEKAYRKELRGRRDAAVKQATMNSAAGKNHMKPSNGSADGLDTVAVPDDVLAEYRRHNPRMTHEDIRRHYSNFRKQIEKGQG